MTTAHRPTWAPAKGHEEQGGSRAFGPSKQYSARDLAAHTTLKTRGAGQGREDEVDERDLKAELLAREREAARKRLGGASAEEIHAAEERELRRRQEIEAALMPNAEDADIEDDGGGGRWGAHPGADDGGEEDEDEEDSDDDEDDTAALLAELEKIKRERAAAAAAAAASKASEEEKEAEREALVGNPLLDMGGMGGTTTATTNSTDFSLKRRWDDDVVFRNQARDAPKVQKRFINDTIRNDFHRRFLNKYIK